MVNIIVNLSNEDMNKLNKIEQGHSYLTKDLIYVENKTNYTIGTICVRPITLVNENYSCISKYFEIEFTLGSHSTESLIKHSAKLKYTVEYKDILNVLLGEHILVNTIDGKRIFINIKNSV